MRIFSKSEARQEIGTLIKKFESLTSTQRKKYNEANTRKDFILPLFHVLNWDVYNSQSSNEVIEEETTVEGRIDYSFRLHNLTQFLLEAKAIHVDLEKDQWAKQAIEYGWNKGISWVVLTDFEGLKVFNSDWKKSQPQANLTFTYKDYLTNFDDLWLLSRESIEKGELNAQAQKWGITAKRVNVNEVLAKDLIEWREILANNLRKWNKQVSQHDLWEAVQRILDRLIFIRFVEDRNIEEKTLWQAYQKWQAKGNQPANFIKSLAPIFRKYDKEYNSNLFAEHLCEKLETEGDPFTKIIPRLYGEKEAGIKYNFNAINADVLGGVYEQYLGKVQESEGSVSKRKKQGIYYTPSYIVEYIVQNTLGRLLKETPGLADREKIKILDPACGSGSFLLKAFELMDENLRRDRPEHQALRKSRILTTNIYGVDLDEQAIEIARLNLLLKALVSKEKLPMLTDHMKVGNSLIDDPKIDKKAFKWQEEFDEVFKQKNSGFDILIGNPPYVRVDEIENNNKKYFKDFYSSASGKYDLYYLFIERALSLVKQGGLVGLIVPNKFCVANYSKNLRELIFSNAEEIKILSVSRLNIFKKASNYPVILFVKKGKGLKKIEIEFFEDSKSFLNMNSYGYKINNNQIPSLPDKIIPINIIQDQFDLVLKLLKRSSKLDDYCSISEGLRIPVSKENTNPGLKIAKQFQFNRYTPIKKITSIAKDDLKSIIKENSNRYKNIFSEKILIAEDALRISATLDKENFIPQGGVYFLTLKDKKEVELSYLLTVLNSKVLSFLYKSLFGAMHMGGGYLRHRSEFLKHLPFIIGTKEQVNQLKGLYNEITKTKRSLLTISKDTDKWQEMKRKETMIENQIDQIAYKLYGLTPEEIKIVEENNG